MKKLLLLLVLIGLNSVHANENEMPEQTGSDQSEEVSRPHGLDEKAPTYDGGAGTSRDGDDWEGVNDSGLFKVNQDDLAEINARVEYISNDLLEGALSVAEVQVILVQKGQTDLIDIDRVAGSLTALKGGDYLVRESADETEANGDYSLKIALSASGTYVLVKTLNRFPVAKWVAGVAASTPLLASANNGEQRHQARLDFYTSDVSAEEILYKSLFISKGYLKGMKDILDIDL